MKIVEIGCGERAGPHFGDDYEHFAVDTNAHALNTSLLREPALTAINADARHMPQFEDASINVILARNVFGDPYLGVDWQTVRNIFLTSTKCPEYDAAVEQSDNTKIALLREAGRLLIAGGKLVIVEQLTPEHAESFFARLEVKTDGYPNRLTQLVHGNIANLTPAKYANAHRHARKVWSATRNPC
ncbi:MAG TPA: class I SAM-dependent methyltransferase [Candidatus Saccharimonadales bacterium]|nr:class I SAM-dependent methyltransferase [Candidatus Saccharimonadales bacterium]